MLNWSCMSRLVLLYTSVFRLYSCMSRLVVLYTSVFRLYNCMSWLVVLYTSVFRLYSCMSRLVICSWFRAKNIIIDQWCTFFQIPPKKLIKDFFFLWIKVNVLLTWNNKKKKSCHTKCYSMFNMISYKYIYGKFFYIQNDLLIITKVVLTCYLFNKIAAHNT